MQTHKFNTLLNPHGVVYNPESIATAIRHALTKKIYTEQDLFFANNCYHSWEHHSRFSNTNATACLSEINERIALAHAVLKNSGWLFITYTGTSKQENG
jgi:aspartate/methionine/tyrosine aminotransferase